MTKRATLVVLALMMLLPLFSCKAKSNGSSSQEDAPRLQCIGNVDSDADYLEADLEDSQAGALENGGIQTQQETELISVTTPLLDKGENRLKNIRITIDNIQGKIVMPGEEFSFNESVGERTFERGFREAAVFVDQEVTEEVGGGICQVSSALYAAALRSGFEVTERHQHQIPVDYTGVDEDATVYYGRLDLRFVNNMDSPIRMDFFLGDDDFTVTLTKF